MAYIESLEMDAVLTHRYTVFILFLLCLLCAPGRLKKILKSCRQQTINQKKQRRKESPVQIQGEKQPPPFISGFAQPVVPPEGKYSPNRRSLPMLMEN